MYFKLALGNVKKSISDFAIYFVTLAFGVCVFYAFNSITQQSAVLNLNNATNNMLELLSLLIGGVSVFIAIVLGFLIVYANGFLIRRRKREFGIYLTLGMNRAHVSRVIVYETVLVGFAALVVGLCLGVALSQLMLYVTAAMFKATITTFTFMFSGVACTKTILYFAIIFLVALAFNVRTVSRYKLIDLLNADRKNQNVKLRSLPLSVALFVISVVMIAVAYWLLIDNGLNEINAQFYTSTALVCVGTVLFFFSLSGFLLRAVKSNKRLYLKGLNAFTMRQLNSRINTAFASISIVCLALFLAITSTCGGFALCSSLNTSIENAAPYDVTFIERFGTTPQTLSYPEQAIADNFDMEAALSRDVEGWGDLARDAAQTDYYATGLTYGDLMAKTNYSGFSSAVDMESGGASSMPVVKLSQFNATRALLGKEPVRLESTECLIWCDFEELQKFFRAFIEQNDTIDFSGQALSIYGDGIDATANQTSSFASNTGVLVVPDELIPADAVLVESYLNVMSPLPEGSVDDSFNSALDKAYGTDDPHAAVTTGKVNLAWPYTNELTAEYAISQSAGLSAIVAYLAIYIGFILLIACAAILALQQLSAAADDRQRYTMLFKLGAEPRMIDRALFAQIGIYFLFPLVLAVCHSIVALTQVVDAVKIFGLLDITQPLLITVAFALVIYGGYFLITCFVSRKMIETTQNQRVD